MFSFQEFLFVPAASGSLRTSPSKARAETLIGKENLKKREEGIELDGREKEKEVEEKLNDGEKIDFVKIKNKINEYVNLIFKGSDTARELANVLKFIYDKEIQNKKTLYKKEELELLGEVIKGYELLARPSYDVIQIETHLKGALKKESEPDEAALSQALVIINQFYQPNANIKETEARFILATQKWFTLLFEKQIDPLMNRIQHLESKWLSEKGQEAARLALMHSPIIAMQRPIHIKDCFSSIAKEWTTNLHAQSLAFKLAQVCDKINLYAELQKELTDEEYERYISLAHLANMIAYADLQSPFDEALKVLSDEKEEDQHTKAKDITIAKEENKKLKVATKCFETIKLAMDNILMFISLPAPLDVDSLAALQSQFVQLTVGIPAYFIAFNQLVASPQHEAEECIALAKKSSEVHQAFLFTLREQFNLTSLSSIATIANDVYKVMAPQSEKEVEAEPITEKIYQLSHLFILETFIHVLTSMSESKPEKLGLFNWGNTFFSQDNVSRAKKYLGLLKEAIECTPLQPLMIVCTILSSSLSKEIQTKVLASIATSMSEKEIKLEDLLASVKRFVLEKGPENVKVEDITPHLNAIIKNIIEHVEDNRPLDLPKLINSIFQQFNPAPG